MKHKNFYFLSGFLGLIITTLVVSSMVSAAEVGNSQGNGLGKANIGSERAAEMRQDHDAVLETINSGDYQTWKDLVDSRPRITDLINADNFDQFVEMHQLMQDGDREGAQAIAEELGVPGRGMFGGGPRMGRGSHGDCPYQEE